MFGRSTQPVPTSGGYFINVQPSQITPSPVSDTESKIPFEDEI